MRGIVQMTLDIISRRSDCKAGVGLEGKFTAYLNLTIWIDRIVNLSVLNYTAPRNARV